MELTYLSSSGFHKLFADLIFGNFPDLTFGKEHFFIFRSVMYTGPA